MQINLKQGLTLYETQQHIEEMENIRIEKHRLKVNEYQALRGTTDWFTVDDEVVEKSLKNDLFSICVFDNKTLVGIGILIKNEIEAYLEENAFNNSFIGLMAADGVQKFYHQFGYLERAETRPGMSKLMKK